MMYRFSGDPLLDWQQELTKQAKRIWSWWEGPGPEQQDQYGFVQDGAVVKEEGVWAMAGTLLIGCITFLLNYYSLALILPEAFSLPLSVFGFILEINTLLLTSLGLCLTQYYLGSLAHESYQGTVPFGSKRVLYLIVGAIILLIAVFAFNRTLIFTGGSWSNALAAFMITIIMETGFVVLAGVTDSGFTRPVINRTIQSSWKFWRLVGQLVKAPFALAALELIYSGKLMVSVLTGVRTMFQKLAKFVKQQDDDVPVKSVQTLSPRDKSELPLSIQANAGENDKKRASSDEAPVISSGKEVKDD